MELQKDTSIIDIKEKFRLLIMSDTASYLEKPSLLEMHKKIAAKYLLALVYILSFSEAEKNASDSYFNPGSMVTDMQIYYSFCL